MMPVYHNLTAKKVDNIRVRVNGTSNEEEGVSRITLEEEVSSHSG